MGRPMIFTYAVSSTLITCLQVGGGLHVGFGRSNTREKRVLECLSEAGGGVDACTTGAAAPDKGCKIVLVHSPAPAATPTP